VCQDGTKKEQGTTNTAIRLATRGREKSIKKRTLSEKRKKKKVADASGGKGFG